jgi:topoisomerase IA-like protein
MMKKKFASLMPDQNIGNIGLEEALNSFASERFRCIRKEVQVSNGRYGPTFVMEPLLCPCQRRKSFRCRF